MFYAYGYDKDAKQPRIKHWEQAERCGMDVKQLKEKPDLQRELVYLWNIYADATKGCDTLSYQVIASFEQVRNVKLYDWEIDALFAIDSERVKK